MNYLDRMDGVEPREALKVPDIDGQQLRDPVNVHARGQAGIMYLHTFDFVHDEKVPPTVVHIAAVR
jgi:hypothetical protein